MEPSRDAVWGTLQRSTLAALARQGTAHLSACLRRLRLSRKERTIAAGKTRSKLENVPLPFLSRAYAHFYAASTLHRSKLKRLISLATKPIFP